MFFLAINKNKFIYIGGVSSIAILGLIYYLKNKYNFKEEEENKNNSYNKEMVSQQLSEIRKKINDFNKLSFPTKQGLLFKKSRYLKEWRCRFFAIQDNILFYFDTKNSVPTGHPLGMFNLLDCQFTLIQNEKRPNVFKILEQKTGKNCLISCENIEEFQNWFAILPQIQQIVLKREQICIKLQSLIRKKQQAKRFRELKEASVQIQKFYHHHEGHRKFARFVHNVIKVQSIVRGFLQKLRYRRIKTQVLVIQSHFNTIKLKNRLEKEFTRKRIVQELLATEKSYVYNLKLIIDIFIRPLMNFHSIEQKVLSLSEISGVFGNWEQLYKINSEFLKLIQGKFDTWHTEQLIGDIFISNTDSLLQYTPYVTNFEFSRKLLDKLTASNINFRNFLDAAQRDKRSKYLDISSFLIQPVQRLPRYELLLRDLNKNTYDSHPDKENLVKGISKVKEITMYVNNQQKERENLSQVIQIQQELISDNGKISFSSATRLIRQGDVKVSKKKWNYMYLFNSQLVIIQKKDEKKLVKEIIQLDCLGIRDETGVDINLSNGDLNQSFTTSMGGPSSPDIYAINTSSSALPIGISGNKFKIVINQKVEYSLYFDTPEERDGWFTDIAVTLNRLEILNSSTKSK
ncbi:hypothetical protein DICPUDRAFT_26788 [Dictyostelium purpureum]|uniref:DH domain-containing protein n=1 Tax=Dictyostelium purpureum TaxID=5786 RepID=F0Z955_DICPU|nr:uncharacterized protein DICPUDRAFT_26788 [Dictyostelium purpureum]EGC39520.1 hypothetical protein DICPUDRAFT_26788 [Dictyostelium purpureum]|eukprot:XP_003283967.1 hypothetical protein DICPUDRAFT_26788 [Dictyostelium purpureum]